MEAGGPGGPFCWLWRGDWKEDPRKLPRGGEPRAPGTLLGLASSRLSLAANVRLERAGRGTAAFFFGFCCKTAHTVASGY